MASQLTLCLALHNHQPIGNFDAVIEEAYQKSYLPFLQVFEPYEQLNLSLHTSGPLMMWLVENHPEYVERIKALVAANRVEILGGPFYEPILPMLPEVDRVGQMVRYKRWLESRFDQTIDGMWLPERVWESKLASDISLAGMNYTIVDDFHFMCAGVDRNALTSCYLTENSGDVVRLFAGSEPLRYLLPFAPVQQFEEFALETAERAPNSILVFGDDGEKFGTWPDTYELVYERGWLQEFFDCLTRNSDWLRTRTLRQTLQTTAPVGKTYLPDCSYREMTRWALPVEKQKELAAIEKVSDEQTTAFLKGGVWHNFRVKYSEVNEMYSKMLEISRRLESARHSGLDPALIPQIEDHLYRAQCNCPYWHGAFGGVYLPHLRNATYRELIAADNLLCRMEGKSGDWIEILCQDFNNDLHDEIKLSNDLFALYFDPAHGGIIYELDLRQTQHNLLATMNRRPEIYHESIREMNAETDSGERAGDAASIHSAVRLKQSNLDHFLQYDVAPRKCFVDHFWDNDLCLEDLVEGRAMERGDFACLPFQAKVRRSEAKSQVLLSRDGNAWGVPFRLTKAVTVEKGSNTLECSWLFEDLPPGRPFHYSAEWNFAGLPADADDRFYFDDSLTHLGHLGTRQDFANTRHLGMIDQWLGIEVQMQFTKVTPLWCYPIETVSQSESGCELVHQSVCVMPHWTIEGDVSGRWSVSMKLAIRSSSQPTAVDRMFADLSSIRS